MSIKQFFITSAAAFTLALAGAVSAAEDPDQQTEMAPEPKEVKTPVSDPAAQAKTEQMLKEEAKELTGEPPVPSEVKNPTPGAQAQEKTEKEVEELQQMEESD